MTALPASERRPAERLRVHVRGSVQGVGFRPFVHRLADELGLAGSVCNLAGGVRIDVEGDGPRVTAFLSRLSDETPVGAHIEHLDVARIPAQGAAGFAIAASSDEGDRGPWPADAAVCGDCVTELLAPSDRRHRYPFVSCAVCGPRFSILEAPPWDRARTAMREFPMCAACEAEYRDPWDRRFHAQTNCCPACGPRVALWDSAGRVVARDDAALRRAVHALTEGAILAVKGLGGFQLVADAGDPRVVRRLRDRKNRPDKPLAVLVRDLAMTHALCRVTPGEASVLDSAAAPIVLLPRRDGSSEWVAPAVAPENPDLGVLLPTTPLHVLLAADFGAPLVATSANRSGDPLHHSEADVTRVLAGVADLFLVHDRPIVHPVDDSVVRVVRGRPSLLRAARGYAPMFFSLPNAEPGTVGWGSVLKNTVAVTGRGGVWLSPHIGDLRSPRARSLASETATFLAEEERPGRSAVDLHPGAGRDEPEEVRVQHHHAHVLACMAEHGIAERVLGVAWDGNGYGPDGTIWGGEFLVCDGSGFERLAHLRTFPLPGAERAIVEGRRAALGLLHELRGTSAIHDIAFAPVRSFRASERRTIARMLQRGLNCPRTSSIGRLFDAVASLTDLRHKATFEGQAAMALEFAARDRAAAGSYPFPLHRRTAGRPWVADWGPLVDAVLRDLNVGLSVGWIAASFHDALAGLIVRVAERAEIETVVLAGGCFQNRLLLERAVDRLRSAGFLPVHPVRIPPGDAGIALGQVVHAVGRPGRKG